MSDRDQNRPDGDVSPTDTPGADELRKAAAARYGLSFSEDADAADVGGAEVDDDVTVAAGSAELEELRRAAAAGGVVAGVDDDATRLSGVVGGGVSDVGGAEVDDDVTVAAGSAELEELRRAAAAGGVVAGVDDDATRLSGVVGGGVSDVGGAEVDDDVTVAAGSAELEELRRAAAAGGVVAGVDDDATRVIEPIQHDVSPAVPGSTSESSGGEPVDVVEPAAATAAAKPTQSTNAQLIPPSEAKPGRWAPAGMLSHSSDHYRNGDAPNAGGGNRRLLMISSGLIALLAVVLVGSVLLFGGGNADADPSASGGSSTTIPGQQEGSALAVPSTVSISSAKPTCDTTVGVTLTWNKADDGGHPFIGYEVSSALATDVESAVWSDWTSAGRIEIYTVEDLEPGAFYAFKVRAVNEIGPSEPSTDLRADEPTCIAPGVPQDLMAKREDTTMNATWDAPAVATGLLTYLVDVEALDDEGKGQKFGEQIRVLSTSALIENVDNELAYRIQVTACNPAGCSEPTPWKRKAPKVLKDQP